MVKTQKTVFNMSDRHSRIDNFFTGAQRGSQESGNVPLSRSSSAMSVGSESSDTLMSPPTSRPSSSQGMREDNSDKHLGKGSNQEDFDEVM